MIRVEGSNGALRALENLIETTGPHSKKRFVCKFEFCFLNQIEVDQPFKCGEIFWQ